MEKYIDPVKRSELELALELRALNIIREKGLNFCEFFNTTDLYHYNLFIKHSGVYKCLTPEEYDVLLIVVKRERDRLATYYVCYVEEQEKLNELKERLKAVQWEFKGNKISKSFEVEYEDEGDQFQFYFNYNYQKKRYECGVSVYHASEDNNCEYPESHTDEEDYFNEDFDELVKELKDYYGISFTKHFKEELLK